jgi:hypothetical protein
MLDRRLLIAASLCFFSSVSQAGPLEVSFVLHDSESLTQPHGPKNQTGHYVFSFADAEKRPPPATPAGYGLANFPGQAGGGWPPGQMPALPPLGQDRDKSHDFDWPGQPGGAGPRIDGAAPVVTAEVPEPASLALLLMGLMGLAGLRARSRA